MRKIIIAMVLLMILLNCTGCGKTIGTVESPERDRIIVNDVVYVDTDSVSAELNLYSSADKGKFIGTIEDGSVTLRVYEIKGDKNRDYLYVRWEWEGDTFVREDLVKN